MAARPDVFEFEGAGVRLVAERLAARAKIDLSKYRPERKGQQDQERTVSQKPPDRDRER